MPSKINELATVNSRMASPWISVRIAPIENARHHPNLSPGDYGYILWDYDAAVGKVIRVRFIGDVEHPGQRVAGCDSHRFWEIHPDDAREPGTCVCEHQIEAD